MDPRRRKATDAHRLIERIGRTLPGVERATRYDGAMVLRAAGVFLAGVARHPSAEAGSLVVKVDPEDRTALLEEAPGTYYVPEYYRPYPVVLVRLSMIDETALHDLLAMSLRYLSIKTRRRPSATF